MSDTSSTAGVAGEVSDATGRAWFAEVSAPHAETGDNVLTALHGSHHGLSRAECAARLERFGRNALPRAKPPGMFRVFLHQFASPLIYVLVVAALFSLAIREFSDAGFIFGVLLVNAIIGTVQEYSAQRAAAALNQLVSTSSRVLRDGDLYEIDAEELVPGDIVMLESGDKVPADLRLLARSGPGGGRIPAHRRIRGGPQGRRQRVRGGQRPGRSCQHGLCRHPGESRAGPRCSGGHRPCDRTGSHRGGGSR